MLARKNIRDFIFSCSLDLKDTIVCRNSNCCVMTNSCFYYYIYSISVRLTGKSEHKLEPLLEKKKPLSELLHARCTWHNY